MQAIATTASQAKHPGLWRGLVGAWFPGLSESGGRVKNYANGAWNVGTTITTNPLPEFRGKYVTPVGAGANYITLGTDYNFDLDTWTFACWMKITSLGSSGVMIFYRGNSSSRDLISAYIVGSGLGWPQVEYYGGGFDDYARIMTSFDDGLWHHLVFVRNNSTAQMKVYADGKLGTSASFAVRSHLSNTDPTSFGNRAGYTGAFKCFDAFFYNREITPQEVQLLYIGESPFYIRKNSAVAIPSIAQGQPRGLRMAHNRTRLFAGQVY